MPLEEGTHIQDSKEITIPQDSKVATKDSREVITARDSKVTTKDSRGIIMTQTKGAFHKEIGGGIMDLLGKEIIGETTGIILPPMVETMGKVEILAMDNVTQVKVRGPHKWS
jgi:hypothetical protein